MENTQQPNSNSQKGPLSPSDLQNPRVAEQKQEALLDFSSMFKTNGIAKRPISKQRPERSTQNKTPNWLLQIPAKLQISREDLERRRYINEQKWKMITKTNESIFLPVAAFASCFSFLAINNKVIQQPAACFKSIKDSLLAQNYNLTQNTRRQITTTCYQHAKSQFQADWMGFKIHQFKEGEQSNEFLNYLCQNMKNPQKTFIYICYGQILCPIGFENTPLVPLDAYKKLEDIKSQKMQMWLIFGSPSKQSPPLVIKRWSDIEKQMTSRWPQFVDLSQAKKGRQSWQGNDSQVSAQMKQISCWIELSYLTKEP